MSEVPLYHTSDEAGRGLTVDDPDCRDTSLIRNSAPLVYRGTSLIRKRSPP